MDGINPSRFFEPASPARPGSADNGGKNPVFWSQRREPGLKVKHRGPGPRAPQAKAQGSRPSRHSLTCTALMNASS